MNAIMLTVAVATVAVIPLARRWPYQVIIIDLAGQTVSLAWAITTGSGFFIGLSGSLIGVLLVLLFYLGGRGRRRPAPKVIGDESRRVRDALVRALRERASQSPSS